MTKKPTKKNEGQYDATKVVGNPCSNDCLCPGMKMAMDGDLNSTNGGFSMTHIFSMTGAPTRSRISYKPRAKKVPMIILTCCPFCKVNYDELEKQKLNKQKRQAKKVATHGA